MGCGYDLRCVGADGNRFAAEAAGAYGEKKEIEHFLVGAGGTGLTLNCHRGTGLSGGTGLSLDSRGASDSRVGTGFPVKMLFNRRKNSILGGKIIFCYDL